MFKTVINYLTRRLFYGQYIRIAGKLHLEYKMRYTGWSIKVEEVV